MDKTLIDELSQQIEGDIAVDEETISQYSHDASLFELKPQVVVFPKNQKDVEKLVTFTAENKKSNPDLSLTGRSAGTDMAGGSINDSITVGFTKYFNQKPEIHNNIATTQPGVYYRDFEAETLKHNLIFPSYPASREICAMGGIVNNNSGGEKSLQYGKTEKYVKRVKAVLRDGKTYEFKPLTMDQLEKKMAQNDLEGEIYKKTFNLIKNNYDEIMKAKPNVSKNSAGYFLWNVWDKEKGIFDMTKLWVGAQGTLGLMLEADIELVPVHKHREMMIIFLYDLSLLKEIINDALPLQPESFESYDDNTLKLALKYFPEFAKFFGASGIVKSGIAFIPEFLMTLTGGLPKLVLQIDFTGDDPEDLKEKVAILKAKLARFHPKSRVAVDDQEKKYWLIRRESFNLLRGKIFFECCFDFFKSFFSTIFRQNSYKFRIY